MAVLKQLPEQKEKNMFDEIKEALRDGEETETAQLVAQALESGHSATEILTGALLAGMDVIGEEFRDGIAFLPEIMVAARAMKSGIEVLKPYLAEDSSANMGKAVIGTVRGDLHDIGKNLVGIMMEGKGIQVIDLGVDVSAEQFLEVAKENDARIVACSALLTTTMGEMKKVVDLFNEAGLRDKVSIMVGGAPITESFKDSIGADFYLKDAASAADKAKEIMLVQK